MPVSCYSDTEEPPAKCCKFCDESTQSGDGGGGPVSWRIPLDQDLIDTLKTSFPSWFPGGDVGGAGSSVGDLNLGAPLTPPLSLISSAAGSPSELSSGTSPIAERSNSSSGVSSNESSSGSGGLDGGGGGTPASFSFRSSSISSSNSFCASPPSLVIYATQIEQPPGQKNIYQQFLADMAEGQDRLLASKQQQQPGREPPLPLLHIVDSYSFDAATLATTGGRQSSPPKAIVDSSPLQPAMDRNKESLKVKLLVRRPITQLVEQGIIPPLKTSPAIHEQRKQLERAKTGDLLKAKIQQRPNRQELERRHILEHDESHVDPSLAEKQRMLKKARLADQLNSQISHRPGPLELIKKNILHTEEPIERIVKEGLVSFKATSEGLLNRPQHPNSYETFDDDSQSSESDQRTSPPRPDVLEVAAASAGIVTVALTIPTSGGAVVVTSGPILQATAPKMPALTTPYTVTVPAPPPPPPPLPIKELIKTEPIVIKSETPQRFAELCQSVVGTMSPSPTLVPICPAPGSFSFSTSSLSTLSPLSSIASPQSVTSMRSAGPSPLPAKFDAPGKDKYRKKSKSKPATKARPIKFHEYKGPPNAQKSSAMSQAQTEETSYQLLLKQQNFLLEYLEGLHKQPLTVQQQQQQHQPLKQQILMMTETNFVQKPSTATICNNSNTATINMSQPVPSPAPSVASTASTSGGGGGGSCEAHLIDLSKLEKMKVSDLKQQLKRRNLPVSGPKPQLIERLKPYLPLDAMPTVGGGVAPKLEGGSILTSASDAGELCDFDAMNSPHLSLSPESEHEHMDVQQVDSPAPQASINEDLVREQQRKIDELQRKLRESQEELLQMKQNHTAASQIQSREQPINQKLIFKQQLEAKIQKEKMQQIENLQRQQKEYLANQQQVLKTAAAIARNNKPLAATQSQPQLMSATTTAANHHHQPHNPQTKEEAPALAFNENALQQLANKKNVEIVWNGEQALFLVGLPQQQHHHHQQDGGAKSKLVNGHQRAASMPSILVPISSPRGTLTAAEINLAAATTVDQMRSAAGPMLIEKQESQPAKQVPPPPQYEEATQQLLRQQQQQGDIVVVGDGSNSLPNGGAVGRNEAAAAELDAGNGDAGSVAASPIDGQQQQSVNNKPAKAKRVHRNSQMITDVLEILIKNGDLPESAAQVPITPTTPNTNLMLSQSMIFNNNAAVVAAARAAINGEKGVQVMLGGTATPPPPPPLAAVAEDVGPSLEGANGGDGLMGDLDINSMLVNFANSTGGQTPTHVDTTAIQDVPILSPLNAATADARHRITNGFSGDVDDDEESDHVTKTLDMFLSGEHPHHHRQHLQEEAKPAPQMTSDRGGLGANDVVLNNTSNTGNNEVVGGSLNGSEFLSEPNCQTEEMDHFDEFEFMALMKLDMDIGDDSSSCAQGGSTATVHKNATCNSGELGETTTAAAGIRRNMDASLQPSLSEIIEQQQQNHQQQSHLQNQSNFFNGYGGGGMGLVGLDSVNESGAQSSAHGAGGMGSNRNSFNRSELQQQGLVADHRNSHYGANNHGGPTTDHNGNTNCMAQDLNLLNNNNHFSDTPMDIEDFSNSLSSFDFPFGAGASPVSPTSHQHVMSGHATAAGGNGISSLSPFGSSGMHSVAANNNNGINSGGDTGNSGSMNFNALASSSSNSNNNVFGSINSLSDHLVGGGTDIPSGGLLYDSHLPMGHDYSLELFDDLRIPTDSMSWNEVDFPIYGK